MDMNTHNPDIVKEECDFSSLSLAVSSGEKQVCCRCKHRFGNLCLRSGHRVRIHKYGAVVSPYFWKYLDSGLYFESRELLQVQTTRKFTECFYKDNQLSLF